MSAQTQRSAKKRLDDGSYVFTPKSLCEETVVEYVHDFVRDGLGISVNPLNVQQAIQQYETRGAICLFEVATALDYFTQYDAHSSLYSKGFEDRIVRYQYEHD